MHLSEMMNKYEDIERIETLKMISIVYFRLGMLDESSKFLIEALDYLAMIDIPEK